MTYMGVKEGRLGLSEVEKLTSEARKVIAKPESKARKPGVYYVAVEPNAFGIPSVHTCPGRTDECQQDCYAIESERRSATAQKLRRNLDILVGAETVMGMADKLSEMMDDYRERADRLAIPQDKRRFRIHWSGDFFSEDYALAWRITMERNPDINFFTFTRSFQDNVDVLPVLTGTENLDLFLSVDSQNIDKAMEAIVAAPDARVAYLVEYLDDADALIEKMGRQELIKNLNKPCPENMRKENGERKLSLINADGGACARCLYCMGKKTKPWDVIFVKTGLKERPAELPFETAVPVAFKVKGKRAFELIDFEQEFETYLNPDPQIGQPIGTMAMVGAANSQESLF